MIKQSSLMTLVVILEIVVCMFPFRVDSFQTLVTGLVFDNVLQRQEEGLEQNQQKQEEPYYLKNRELGYWIKTPLGSVAWRDIAPPQTLGRPSRQKHSQNYLLSIFVRRKKYSKLILFATKRKSVIDSLPSDNDMIGSYDMIVSNDGNDSNDSNEKTFAPMDESSSKSEIGDKKKLVISVAPSIIELNSVTFQYPRHLSLSSLTRAMFSSIPHREFALQNVTLRLSSFASCEENGNNRGRIMLLVGSSSSGKSTILKLIRQQLKPTSGTITVARKCSPNSFATDYRGPTAMPVLLDQKPSYKDDNRYLDQILQQDINRILSEASRRALKKSTGNTSNTSNASNTTNSRKICKNENMTQLSSSYLPFVLETVIQYLAETIFDLQIPPLTQSLPTSSRLTTQTILPASTAPITTTTLRNEQGSRHSNQQPQRYNQLSPSELYRFQLLRASVESMVPSCITVTTATPATPATTTTKQQHNINDNTTNDHLHHFYFAAPIVLLDEWLDTETSDIIEKVRTSLQRLSESLGAVCCIVTHKPERWLTDKTSIKSNNDSKRVTNYIRTITLSRGHVFMDQ